MDPNVFVAILVAIGIALTFFGLDLLMTSRRIVLSKRVDIYRHPSETGAPISTEDLTTKSSRSRQNLATELARAGLPVTSGEFIVVTLFAVILGAIVTFALFQHVVALLIGALLGLFAPRYYLRYLQRRRLDAFNGQLESTIVLLMNTLRSGHGLGQAFESVAKESSPPLSVEFDRVVREIALGISIREALANLLLRNPSDDLDLMITAINVNHEVGGNLTEVLERIAGTIRERVRLAGEMRSITSMQRFSAQILTLLPLGLTALLYLMNPSYIELLWTKSCGLIMLAVWAVLTILGLLFIRRLLAFRY